MHNQFNVIVINFVDMLSYARTKSKIRELAQSEAAYRSLTRSWFQHSTTLDLFKKLADKGYKVIIAGVWQTLKHYQPIGRTS